MSNRIQQIFERVQEYTVDRNAFEPFKLTFKMQSPLSMAHPWMHLDGILAHLLLRRILQKDYYCLPTNLPLDFFEVLQLPLEASTKEDKTIYHCSASFFNYSTFFATTIYKRFDDMHVFLMNKAPKKVQKGRGKYRDYMMKLGYIPATEVSFYGNGDIQDISDLIEKLPGLGKKTAIGFGLIKSFEMKLTKKDMSIVNEKNIAMRQIPLEFIDIDKTGDVEQALLGYKFPYWGKRNICICIPPGEKVWITLG